MADLQVQLVVSGDAGQDARVAELWDLVVTPPALTSTVDVGAGAGAAALSPLPAQWAVIVRRVSAAGVTGPDFRSQAMAQATDAAAVAQIEVAITEPQQLSAAALTDWLAAALATPPARFDLPGGIGWAAVANLAGVVVLAPGALELQVTGTLTYVVGVIGGTQTAGNFTAGAKVALAASNAPASTDLVDVQLIGQPEIVLPGIAGAVAALVSPAVGAWVAGSLVAQFAANAQQRLPAMIAAALGAAAVPEGATFSLPGVAISTDAVTYQAAMGALTVGADHPTPGSGARVLWTQRQDIGPSPRGNHAMAYDPSAQRVLLFGGAGQGFVLGDSWVWDRRYWTQVQDIGPAARSGHALAFDTGRGRAVLFGGTGDQGDLADTWEWDGAYWTQVADTGPAARALHASAYDKARGRLVMFGGATPAARFADTWEWDGDAWTQVQDAGPSARRRHAMAFDADRGRVVLFGGAGDQGDLGDTWEWDGEEWTSVADTGPDARLGHVLVGVHGAVLLHGGQHRGAPQVTFSDTWLWRDALWTKVQDMGPTPRWGHAAAYDPARSLVVMFGGHDAADPAALLGDTWECNGADRAVNGG